MIFCVNNNLYDVCYHICLCFHPSSLPSSTHYALSKIQYFFAILQDGNGLYRHWWANKQGGENYYVTHSFDLQNPFSHLLRLCLALGCWPSFDHFTFSQFSTSPNSGSWVLDLFFFVLTQNDLALPQLIQTHISSLMTPFNRKRHPRY